MNNGILALAMIGFTGPVTFATWRGGAAQRALNWDAQWASFKLDLESLKAGALSLSLCERGWHGFLALGMSRSNVRTPSYIRYTLRVSAYIGQLC